MKQLLPNQEEVLEYCQRNNGKRCFAGYVSCFDKLSKYLQENRLDYSRSIAAKWLDTQKDIMSDQYYGYYRAAINRLNDYNDFGEIPLNHIWHIDYRSKLNDSFVEAINQYVDSISSLATNKTLTYKVSKLLFMLQENGTHTIDKISFSDHLFLNRFFDTMAADSKMAYRSAWGGFIKHLADKCVLPRSYIVMHLLWPKTPASYWDLANSTLSEKIRIDQSKAQSITIATDAFLKIRDTIANQYASLKYNDSTACRFVHVANLLYVFMEMNNLEFSPEVTSGWLEVIKSCYSSHYYRNARKYALLIEQGYKGEQITGFNSNMIHKPTAEDNAPEWCKAKVNEFALLKSKQGCKKSTISGYKSFIYNFAQYLDSNGISDWQYLDAKVIKEFNVYDKHKTPQAKNGCNSSIRRFLFFLYDEGIITDPSLAFALPTMYAPMERIGTVLSDEEQAILQKQLFDDDSPLSLRNRAIIGLGTYTGLRGIDIVNIKSSYIDWDHHYMIIPQQKTSREIERYIPDPVFEIICRYVVEERPETDSEYLFIRSIAPYRQLTRGNCIHILKKAIPGWDDGFHPTRRTFGTNMLRNGASAQEVADALGHSGLGHVHLYMSRASNKMGLCALSMESQGISLEGGFIFG